ncbi:MAG: glycosyltransferase family 2 protein, partial [Akkermansia sp.]
TPMNDNSPDLDFTIVTPSYNYGHFITECIESVLQQKGATWEHIIQDSCSTDNTHEILQSYPHLKVSIEKDSGMSEGINRGFRKARGKWVMWLNTDDILKPGVLAAVKAFAEQHPEADVIHGAWEFVDEHRNHQRTMKALPYCHGLMVYYGCYIASTACFFRNQTIMGQDFFLNESFRYDMDGEYYVRLGVANKTFVPFNKVLAEFRWHGNNLSFRHEEEHNIDMELLRRRQIAELSAISFAYGNLPFKRDVHNELLRAFKSECYRAYKGWLTYTTKKPGQV